MKRWGRVDILVNNAGGATTPVDRSLPSSFPMEDLQEMLNMNLMSAIHCCQAVAPVMRAPGSGVIVNTASIAARGVSGRGSLAPYAVARAAVLHYTRNLAAELGPDGIRANCIAPGTILGSRVAAQAMARGIGAPGAERHIPLRRLGTVED